MKKVIGIILIGISLIIIFLVFYMNSRYSKINRTFSPYTLLTSTWEKYKQKFINKDGRVIDFSANSVTTSEGQSYALLRAVWSDDRKTFDTVWKFTSTNLKRKQDNLFGWRWGKLSESKYGFLPDGGENTASDADSDIALALILANRRWKKDEYLARAKVILNDMWRLETAVADGERYFLAGNWADRESDLILNPSYFSPFAWRIFAEVDKKHDWNSLIEPAYEILNKSGTAPLDKTKGVGLPPNWLSIEKSSGELRPPNIPNATTDYSFDAMRTPWRIALDYQWNKDEKARQYLIASYNFLKDEYNNKQKLASAYSHEGKPLTEIENPIMYSTSIGYFQIADPELAKDIYENKIIKLYSNAEDSFDNRLPYYEQNWLWFGLALYNGQIRKY